SGFSSRVLIAECLHVSKEVAELISAGRVNELQALSELPASDVLPLSSDLEKQLRVGNLNFKQYCQQVETK
ncbi:MAG: hypothetical protein KDD42_08925, partial [Bdellovibrionales bacterium]|nr:hypothetical protein [Bdellovibrionales bacterium]